MIKIKYPIKSKKEVKRAAMLIRRAQKFYGHDNIGSFLTKDNYIILFDTNTFYRSFIKKVYDYKENIRLDMFIKYLAYLVKSNRTITFNSFYYNIWLKK